MPFSLRPILRYIFVLIACAICSLPAYARDYIVEAVVFSHQEVNQQNHEVWDASAPRTLERFGRIRNLISGSRTVENLLQLNVLPEILSRLSASPAYKVLKTISWEQAQANYGNSKRVRIKAQYLQGIIHVYAPSLLFAEMHLQYSPQGLFSTTNGTSPSYFINEKRKIKLNETHYYDHPQFGVIVNVRPKK